MTIRKLKCRLRRWWDKLWFNEMPRNFARDMDRAAQHSIDFGPEPIKNLFKWWCRDHHIKWWQRFFINWNVFNDELEHITFVRSYE